MAIGNTYHLRDGKIWECSDLEPTDKCLTLPDQNLEVTDLYVEDDEIFALTKKGERTALFHFQQTDQSWEEFGFDITESCNMMSGICYTTNRDAVTVSSEQGHIIVRLDDGTQERAKIYSDDMYFSSHASPISTDNIRKALHQIASTDSAPNRFMMARLPKTFGPSAIDNRWEKIQAREWLETRLESCDDPREKLNIQLAIQNLEETTENDQIIYEPNKALQDNTYCDEEKCHPILHQRAFNESANAYTMRFTNFIPDNVSVSQAQWDYVTEPFDQEILSAADERLAIAEAGKRWELIMGSDSGSAQDIGGWLGNIVGLAPSWIPVAGQETGQTNCNYEYFNMRELMRKLQAGGQLQYHEVPEAYSEGLATIGYGMIHQAMRMQEKESDDWYVVDSWPRGNGYPPMIMPEDDWNVLSASSSDIFPTQESLDRLEPTQRFVTGALGLGITSWLAKRGVHKQMTPMRLVLPRNEWAGLVRKQGEALNSRTFYAERQLYHSTHYSVWKDLTTIEGHERGYQIVEAKNLDYFPREAQGRVIGYMEKRSPGGRSGGVDSLSQTKSKPLVYIKRQSIPKPMEWGACRYLMRPQGALNFGLMVLFGSEMLSALWAEQAEEIPNSSLTTRSRIADQIASYSATGYLGAEGAMAVRYGTTPFLYELPVAGPPFVLGATLSGGLSHELGEALDMRTLQNGGTGQLATEIGGGTAAVWAFKKAVGQQAWNGATQQVNRFALQTIGEAGLALEAGAATGLGAASLGEIAATGSAATIGASAVLVAAAGAVGVGVGLLYNKLIVKPIIEPYILEPYVDPLYAKHILPTQEKIEGWFH